MRLKPCMLKALADAKWNFQAAAHLLNRAGFGGTPADIEKLQKLGPDKAVDYLVDYEKTPDATEAPDRSEERRVGKESRLQGAEHEEYKIKNVEKASGQV